MRKSEHMTARALATLGLLAGVLYLGWRVAFSWDGASPLMWAVLLAAEVAGLAGTAALTWALWPAPAGRRTEAAESTFDGGDPVDVVVRVVDQPLHELRATLLGVREMADVADVLVVDHGGRPEVVRLAAEFDCSYAATDLDDPNGIEVMRARVRTARFVLVDAGDVPSQDLVQRLSVDLADSDVAVVQGLGVSLAADSPEHGPSRRHDLVFERSSLNPALGRRGLAMWLGSGSLVRTVALVDVPACTAAVVEAHWHASAALHRAGWRVTAPTVAPVVAHRTLTDAADVYADRVVRARAARRMVADLFDARRGMRRRLAALAWSVRPLSGFRRLAVLAVLCAVLLSGDLPMQPSAVAVFALWVPSMVYGSLGISLLSGWTLRPGDRARWSLHNIGADVAGLRTEQSQRAVSERQPIIDLPAGQYGIGLVVAVLALTVVLSLRGVSEQFTHTLGVMPHSALLAAMVVGVWHLCLALDQLRVLARRTVRRRAARVGTELRATLHDELMAVVDITPLGAGLVGLAGFDVGERVPLHVAVPTRSGVTDLRLPVVVRNVSVSPAGEWRVGVEFLSVDTAAANVLAEFCTVEPVWESIGSMPGVSVLEARPVPGAPLSVPNAGRATLRVMAFVALGGVVASSLPSAASAAGTSGAESGGHALSAGLIGVVGAVVVGMLAGLVNRGRDRRPTWR